MYTAHTHTYMHKHTHTSQVHMHDTGISRAFLIVAQHLENILTRGGVDTGISRAFLIVVQRFLVRFLVRVGGDGGVLEVAR
jgi:hypothetical protein